MIQKDCFKREDFYGKITKKLANRLFLVILLLIWKTTAFAFLPMLYGGIEGNVVAGLVSSDEGRLLSSCVPLKIDIFFT